MAARDTILDNFKTALEAVTEANGYNTTVKRVNRGPMPFDTVKNDCPFIAIVEGDEQTLLHDDTNVRYNITIALILYIKGYLASGMSDSMNKFMDDVKKLIYSPVDLGTYCLQVNCNENDMDVSDSEDMAAGIMSLDIIYYAPKNTF